MHHLLEILFGKKLKEVCEYVAEEIFEHEFVDKIFEFDLYFHL